MSRLLANASGAIDVLARHGPLTVGQLASALAIPRSSAYRLADGLCADDLAETGPDGRLTLTRRWLHLSDAARNGMSEWAGARPILEWLAAETEETAFLTVPGAAEAVCIDWAPGRGVTILALKPGRSLPLHAGAAGRVVLAHSPERDVEAYLARCPLPAFTGTTLTTAAELRADIALTRGRGFAVSDEDVTVGIRSIGAPILSADGSLAGAVSIGGLAGESRESHARLVDAVLAAARRLEGRDGISSRPTKG